MEQKPVVILLGGSGFIGSHLARDFAQKNWRVIVVTRFPDQARDRLGPGIETLAALAHLDPSVQPDLLINLAGASVGEGRWNTARKRTLLASRQGPTQQITQWLKRHAHKPRLIIQASAVGFYGNGSRQQWQARCNESSAPQDVFVSRLCQLWEASAQELHRESGVPVAICRLGVVLGKGGGILPQLLKPVRLGIGRIGSGQQPVCWIHMDDVVGAIQFIAQQPVDQPWRVFNLTAPQATTQQDFAQTAARLLRRKLWLSLPAGLMRTAMGEQADLVLDGQYVEPARLLAEGYSFHYPTLDAALENLLKG